MKPIDLSISLVSFNNKGLLENCLNSIFHNNKDLKFEVSLVDNASKDGTATMVKKKFPKVALIVNDRNVLFTKAHNQNLRGTRGKYFLLLNDDTYIPPLALEKMVDFLEAHPEIGAASAKHIGQNGKTDNTTSRFPTPLTELLESNILAKFIGGKKVLNHYRYQGWKRNSDKYVDVLPGSFMLIRSSVLKKVGHFDENLKLFYSDTDLCIRIKKAGYSLYHKGDIVIKHFRAQSVNKLSPWERYRLSETDMLNFYKKHFGALWWFFLVIAYFPNRIYWRLKTI